MVWLSKQMGNSSFHFTKLVLTSLGMACCCYISNKQVVVEEDVKAALYFFPVSQRRGIFKLSDSVLT